MSNLPWLTFFKPTHPYFLNDQEADGMKYYRTEAERDAAALQALANYMGNGEWGDGVSRIHVGVVTGSARPHNIKHRPEDLEDGVDSTGMSWPEGIDMVCDYVVDDQNIRTAVMES